MRTRLKLLWTSRGDQDGEGRISQSVHHGLTAKPVPQVWHIDSGAFPWPGWKNDLYLLTPWLFRSSPPMRR